LACIGAKTDCCAPYLTASARVRGQQHDNRQVAVLFSMSSKVWEDDFRHRVALGSEKARTALAEPTLFPRSSYAEQFELVESLVGVTFAGFVNVLEVLGLNYALLLNLKEVASAGQVFLGFKAVERCEFDREESRQLAEARPRDEMTNNNNVMVDTTVTEFVWTFQVEYDLFVFAKTRELHIHLRDSVCKRSFVTSSKDAPRPKLVIRDGIDVCISPLLTTLDEAAKLVHFKVNRASKECRTPRRNPQVERAVEFFKCVAQWSDSVYQYFVCEVLPPEARHAVDAMSANEESIFVPVMLLLGMTAATNVSFGPTAAATTIVQLADPRLNGFLEQQKKSLEEKLSELSGVLSKCAKQVTVVEASVLLATSHAQTLARYLEAGIEHVEDFLRQQIVLEIGKEVGIADFYRYMTYHNSRTYKAEYQPKPFCYAVRRSDHSAEGVVSLEAAFSDGSISQPVSTMVTVKQTILVLLFLFNPLRHQILFLGESFQCDTVWNIFFGKSYFSRRSVCSRFTVAPI
jgi:hypothetical protein